MLFCEVYEMIVWYLIFVNKTSKLKFENSKELNLILLYVKHLYLKKEAQWMINRNLSNPWQIWFSRWIDI